MFTKVTLTLLSSKKNRAQKKKKNLGGGGGLLMPCRHYVNFGILGSVPGSMWNLQVSFGFLSGIRSDLDDDEAQNILHNEKGGK